MRSVPNMGNKPTNRKIAKKTKMNEENKNRQNLNGNHLVYAKHQPWMIQQFK